MKKETRTLWEATDTYIKMSPFMSANKIKKPILLIHGEDDSKVTTAMQLSTVACGLFEYWTFFFPMASVADSFGSSILELVWVVLLNTGLPVLQLQFSMWC